MLNDPKKTAFDAVEDVGIVIRTLGPARQVHIGLLYKRAEKPLMIHLRDHHDFKSEEPTVEFCWMQIDLEDVNRRVLSGFCAVLAAKGLNVPYGFSYNGLYFTLAGDWIPRGVGEGLTCATFVMAVFETYSFPVLITKEWGPADVADQLWQTQRVGQIGSMRGRLLADSVAKYIGHPRYKPEHVAAGAVDERRPLGLAMAEKLGKRIMRDLDKLRP